MIKRAFTIVELLIVIAIVSVLAGITFPVLREVRSKGKITHCQSNLRQIHVALTIYRSDYGGEARYGDMHSMGLPPDLRDLYTSQKMRRDTFRCLGSSRIPVGPLYTVHYSSKDEIGTYPWEEYALKFQESSVVYGDQNHELAGHDVISPAVDHRRIGVYLDGHTRVIVRKGDPFVLPWWNAS